MRPVSKCPRSKAPCIRVSRSHLVLNKAAQQALRDVTFVEIERCANGISIKPMRENVLPRPILSERFITPHPDMRLALGDLLEGKVVGEEIRFTRKERSVK